MGFFKKTKLNRNISSQSTSPIAYPKNEFGDVKQSRFFLRGADKGQRRFPGVECFLGRLYLRRRKQLELWRSREGQVHGRPARLPRTHGDFLTTAESRSGLEGAPKEPDPGQDTRPNTFQSRGGPLPRTASHLSFPFTAAFGARPCGQGRAR